MVDRQVSAQAYLKFATRLLLCTIVISFLAIWYGQPLRKFTNASGMADQAQRLQAIAIYTGMAMPVVVVCWSFLSVETWKNTAGHKTYPWQGHLILAFIVITCLLIFLSTGHAVFFADYPVEWQGAVSPDAQPLTVGDDPLMSSTRQTLVELVQDYTIGAGWLLALILASDLMNRKAKARNVD